MKLCITGSFGNRDIGDEAMLTEVLDYLLSDLKISRQDIFLFGYQPEYISWYHQHPLENCYKDNLARYFSHSFKQKCKDYVKNLVGLPPLILPAERKKISKVAAIIDNCDCLIVTGGGTINTRDHVGESLHRMQEMTKTFASRKKPIFFCAQTIGPLGIFPDHDQIAGEIIKRADRLFLRDPIYSKRYLSLIGSEPKHHQKTYDDAATLPYEKEEIPNDISDFINSNKTISLNVTFYTANTDEKRFFIARLAEALLNEFGTNLVFTSHTPWDYAISLGIYDMISNSLKNRVMVPDVRNWRDKQLKRLISACCLVVGGRYHNIVFAGSSNTPFVGMSGNHYSFIKNDGFARIFGYEDFILSEKESWDMDTILAKARKAIGTEFDIRSRIDRPSPTIRELERWLRTILDTNSSLS